MIGRAVNINPWRAATFAVPVATIFLAVVMMPMPFAIKLWGYWLMPSLPILAIFLWAMHRPDLLSPIAVLAAGILMDLLIHAPIGASGLAFLAAYSITASQRLYWMTLPGPGIFVGFIIVMIAAETLSWLATSFAYGHLIGPLPGLLEAVMSIIVYPFARRIFGPLQRLAGPAV